MQLKKITRISPSKFSLLKQCPLKVALSNTLEAPLLPYHPSSHLGTVIHKCINLILQDKIETTEDFELVWFQLIKEEEQKILFMGFEHLIPLDQSVPAYTIKKLQTKSFLFHHINHTLLKKGNAQVMTEKWLQSEDNLIGGYVDYIFNSNGYVKISDFKTGEILSGGKIKIEYKEQIILYAHLYKKTFGKYPDKLSLIDLGGKEHDIDYSYVECERLAAEAKDLLLKINKLIEINNFKQLSNPSQTTCLNCLYRPACVYYWETSFQDCDNVYKDVKGIILGIRQFNNGDLSIKINKSGSDLVISHVNSKYFSYLCTLVGKEVAFYNVKSIGLPGRYQFLKTTKFYAI